MRLWPVLAIAFSTLLFIAALSGLESWRRMGQVYETMRGIDRSHGRADDALGGIESGIYISGIFARDFLLDPSNITADLHREELLQIRSQMEKDMAALSYLVETDPKLAERLRREVDQYWDSLDPIFEWTPQQKSALSSLFLRKRVLPRRKAVLDLAAEVKALNAADLRQKRGQMESSMTRFRRTGQRMLLAFLACGLAVSAASLFRISQLERRADQQYARSERAEQELRRLSQQLVRAQEDERRNISRELHDEVGQTLTGLRMELGTLDKLREGPEGPFHEHLEEARDLAARTLQSVRNLAAGLRPSMLDDLGLGAALEWQARDFSRRTGIPVEVAIDGLPAELPDQHRTCLYRVVQEALTNCARHAEAHHIRITLHCEADRLAVAVQDDGCGLAPGAPRTGLGLLGIEERARELGGYLAIKSQPGKGTLLRVSIPLSGRSA